MNAHSTCRTLCVAFAVCGVVTACPPAHALQPLEAFVASAKRRNPDDLQAAAVARQKAAEVDVSRAVYLPSFTAQGTYTRNQWKVAFALPGETPITLTPTDQVDAYFTLAVPLINVGAWEQRRASELDAESAEASRLSTEVTVESSVVQAYYQLLGSEALLASAKESLQYAESNLATVRDRASLGTASELDVQRAIGDVASAQQDLANADQTEAVAERTLESLSRLTPEPATAADYVEDDLHEEAPLSSWLRSTGDDLLVVRPAVLSTQAAAATRSAARAAWLPTISAQAQEHDTNAGGFSGHYEIYTLSATATWKLDFSIAPNIRAQTEALIAAQAGEDKTRRAADDAIYQAWYQVRADIVKARSARAQVKANTLSLELARERYASGTATQLEVVQAQRDFFSAAVSQAQADADLQYARALLRLDSRRTGDVEMSR